MDEEVGRGKKKRRKGRLEGVTIGEEELVVEEGREGGGASWKGKSEISHLPSPVPIKMKTGREDR